LEALSNTGRKTKELYPFKKEKLRASIVIQACNSNTQKAEAEGLQV
jgi:hypothetical protein